jgi:hypothetical protein
MRASAKVSTILSLIQGRDNPQKSVEKRERAALRWKIYPVAGDRLALAIQFGTAWNNFTAFSSVK